MSDNIFTGSVRIPNNLGSVIKESIAKNPPVIAHNSTLANIEKENERLQKIMDDKHKRDFEKEQATIQREEKQIELLEQIKNNTSNMVNMLDMIRFNSNQQTEILMILSEILEISTTNSVEEAESSYRKVMAKINQNVEDVETSMKLVDWAKIAYTYIKMQYFGE